MNNTFLILLMIFLHIIDDYVLQGILASMKQKAWWKENAPDELYRHDYIWALIMHSFSWSFMIMLPIAYIMNFQPNGWFLFMFALNILTHAVTDNAKANLRTINLWFDQIVHMRQIILTFVFMILMKGAFV